MVNGVKKCESVKKNSVKMCYEKALEKYHNTRMELQSLSIELVSMRAITTKYIAVLKLCVAKY